MARYELLGILAAMLSSLLGGTAVVATRFVIGGTDPATLGVLRFSIGVACLFLLLGLAKGRPARADVVPIALLGMLFFAAFPWLFNQALAWTTAAHGALALATLPLLTLVVGAVLGVERLTPLKLAGVVIAFLGVGTALIGRLDGTGLEGAWRGDLVMVGAALCGAFYNVLARPYLRRYPALAFTAYAMLGGVAALVILSGLGGTPSRVASLGPAGWSAIVYLGIIGGAFTFWLWSVGLERTTPTRVAISVSLNPVSAMTLGAVLLGEPLAPRLFVGLAAIVIGILLTSWRERTPVGAKAAS